MSEPCRDGSQTRPPASPSKIHPKERFRTGGYVCTQGAGRAAEPSRFHLPAPLLSSSFHFPSTWLQSSTWLSQAKPNKPLRWDLEGIPSGSWHSLKLSALS